MNKNLVNVLISKTEVGEVVDNHQVKCEVEHEGKQYALYFNMLEDFDPNTTEDLSDSCDWSKPVMVWDIEEGCKVE